MFWRTKTATSQQSPNADLGSDRAQLHENFVREPANRDMSPDWSADLTEIPSSSEQVSSGRAYVIPRSYRISGNLLLSRAVVVQGEVVGGAIDATTVVVLPGGRLAAPTKAVKVAIEGVVEGDVSASAELSVGSQAVVRGSLNAPVIRVEPGAQVSEAMLFVGPKR
jgi:cytoskeletal protein CcmA (bactofilin family)